MNKINTLIENMKELYKEFNLIDVKDIDMDGLKKLRDFSKGYASDVQELIYGFEEMKQKMVKEGICPHCNKLMKYENGENKGNTEYWWECKCGRSYDTNGKDITDYECTDVG